MCENSLENCPKSDKMVSWRGLGEVLGALGVPLGPEGGFKSGFRWIFGAFWAPFLDGLLINNRCFFEVDS